MRKGYTIIEFLVTMVIVFIVLSGAYIAFTRLMGGFKGETESVETQIELSVSLELMRLDIEHAGYGIGEDQNIVPVEIDGNEFIIRSVLNNTRQSTIKWALLDCSGASPSRIAGDSISSSQEVVFLGAGNRHFVSNGVFGTCPGGGIYVAIPYEASTALGGTGGVQAYNEIIYRLSTTSPNPLQTCHRDTRNLLRVVGSGRGTPLLNCVADWRVTFDIDRDGDGNVDVFDGAFEIPSPAPNHEDDLDLDNDGIVTPEEVRRGLRKVNVYVLVQEGSRDPDYTFTNTVSCTTSPSGACVRVDTGAGTLDLNLPLGYENYRWKTVKLFVKPMNL